MTKASKPKKQQIAISNEAIEWARFFYSLYQQKKLKQKR
jgi:hypothetical protein